MMLLLLLAAAMPRETPPPAPAPASPLVQIDGLPLDVLPRQTLPDTGCAAYLWTKTDKRLLLAMVSADAGRLRLAIDGAIVDLPRTAQRGAVAFGLNDSTDYAVLGTRVTLDIRIETRADLTKGAAVPEGSLRIDRDGKDGVVVPVTGLVGCAG